jgi:hypothetical protein
MPRENEGMNSALARYAKASSWTDCKDYWPGADDS